MTERKHHLHHVAEHGGRLQLARIDHGWVNAALLYPLWRKMTLILNSQGGQRARTYILSKCGPTFLTPNVWHMRNFISMNQMLVIRQK